MIQRVLASKGVAAYLLALATGITLYVHGDAISLPGESFWIGTQAPFCRAMRNAQELCRQNPIISGVCRCQESPRNHPKAPPSTIHALEEMLGLRAQTVDYLQARLSLSRNAPIKNPTLTLSE